MRDGCFVVSLTVGQLEPEGGDELLVALCTLRLQRVRKGVELGQSREALQGQRGATQGLVPFRELYLHITVVDLGAVLHLVVYIM